MGNTLTLADLKIGESAVIYEVKGEDSLRCRLLDMGLIPKTQVTIHKVAPMGDPIELRLRGYRLTLRAEDARGIIVAKEGDL